MSSPKQIAGSRANGAKSKGPVTAEGKRVSSRNSTRHGLFAENIVLEDEKTHAFLALVESLFEEHSPRTPTQKLLVENIAAARWRQWRIWGTQKVAFDYEIASQPAETDPPLCAVLAWRNSADSLRTHELLLRYEIAPERQISRSLLRLQQLKAQDLEAQELQPEECERRTSVESIDPPPLRKPPASEPQAETAKSAMDKESITTERKGMAVLATPGDENEFSGKLSCGTNPANHRKQRPRKFIFGRTRETTETIVQHTSSIAANPRPDSGAASASPALEPKTDLQRKKGTGKLQ